MAKAGRPPKQNKQQAQNKQITSGRHHPPSQPPVPPQPPRPPQVLQPIPFPLTVWRPPPPQAQPQPMMFRHPWWQPILARFGVYVLAGLIVFVLVIWAFRTAETPKWESRREDYRVFLYRKEVHKCLAQFRSLKNRDDVILRRVEEMSVRGDYAFSQTRLARNLQAVMVYHSLRTYRGLNVPVYAECEGALREVLKHLEIHSFSDPSFHDPTVLKAHIFAQQTNIYLHRLENACSVCEQLINQAR